MFDLQSMRDQLASQYDLAPNPALAEKMTDVYARMNRVVNPIEWSPMRPMLQPSLS